MIASSAPKVITTSSGLHIIPVGDVKVTHMVEGQERQLPLFVVENTATGENRLGVIDVINGDSLIDYIESADWDRVENPYFKRMYKIQLTIKHGDEENVLVACAVSTHNCVMTAPKMIEGTQQIQMSPLLIEVFGFKLMTLEEANHAERQAEAAKAAKATKTVEAAKVAKVVESAESAESAGWCDLGQSESENASEDSLQVSATIMNRVASEMTKANELSEVKEEAAEVKEEKTTTTPMSPLLEEPQASMVMATIISIDFVFDTKTCCITACYTPANETVARELYIHGRLVSKLATHYALCDSNRARKFLTDNGTPIPIIIQEGRLPILVMDFIDVHTHILYLALNAKDLPIFTDRQLMVKSIAFTGPTSFLVTAVDTTTCKSVKYGRDAEIVTIRGETVTEFSQQQRVSMVKFLLSYNIQKTWFQHKKSEMSPHRIEQSYLWRDNSTASRYTALITPPCDSFVGAMFRLAM